MMISDELLTKVLLIDKCWAAQKRESSTVLVASERRNLCRASDKARFNDNGPGCLDGFCMYGTSRLRKILLLVSLVEN